MQTRSREAELLQFPGTKNALGPSDVTTVSYVPNPGFNGFDSFVVQVGDGLFTDRIIVNVGISAFNDPPVIADGESVAVSMSENGSPDAFALKLGASDPDGDPLTWRVSVTPSNGNASVDQTGAVSYKPNAGHSGTDRFEIEVSDGADTDSIIVDVAIRAAATPRNRTFRAKAFPILFSTLYTRPNPPSPMKSLRTKSLKIGSSRM